MLTIVLEFIQSAIKNWKITGLAILIVLLIGQGFYIKLQGGKISNLNLKLELTSKDVKTKEGVIKKYEIDVALQNKAIAKWKSDASILAQRVEQANSNIDAIHAEYETKLADLRNAILSGQTVTLTEGDCKLVRKDSSAEVNMLWQKAISE